MKKHLKVQHISYFARSEARPFELRISEKETEKTHFLQLRTENAYCACNSNAEIECEWMDHIYVFLVYSCSCCSYWAEVVAFFWTLSYRILCFFFVRFVGSLYTIPLLLSFETSSLWHYFSLFSWKYLFASQYDAFFFFYSFSLHFIK